MNECLKFKESNCKNCYKCIRYCPVKAISFKSNQAHIVQTECILCGECVVICPQNAKGIRDDLPIAKKLLRSNSPVYASLAPSFVANYNGMTINSMRKALMQLGFAAVEETAIGATIVKNQYDIMVRQQKQNVIISSCCHTINLLIQRYYHAVLPYLAKVISPMQAHCSAIKRAHPEAKTIFIGPCISKKAEADQYAGIVDCVLTFEELSIWLKEEDIRLESSGEDDQGGKARLFPITGGILRSMEADNKKYSYLAIDGVENCMAALEDISNGDMDNCFIEMSACKGSCIGGPAMDRHVIKPVSGFLSVNKQAGSDDFPVEMPSPEDLKKSITFQTITSTRLGKSAIEKELKKMGKLEPADELNCGSCGYNTCREKAAAIIIGKADVSMCLPYLMERAQSFSDTIFTSSPNGIIVLNEALEVQQLNDAACQIINVKNQLDVIGRQVVCILDPTPFIEVVQNHRNIYEKRVFLAEYGRYVKLTIIYNINYKIMLCFMRDITNSQSDRARKDEFKRKTIEITDKVIENQMRVVQEIASLLGETTAETNVALTKLKETLSDE